MEYPPDRLYRLSGMRLVLRQHWFTSPENVLTATPRYLKDLHTWRSEIMKIVRRGDPQILSLLFVPRETADWQVAGLDSQPSYRSLSATRGKERVVSLVYRVDDDGTDEPRAWDALVTALPYPVSA
jgi:hypothetical protein